MKIENQILLTIALMGLAYGFGRYYGIRYMYRVYGDVLSDEMLAYLVAKDAPE